MSEPKPTYRTDTDEAQEAMDMLGKGYHESPLEIHPQTTVISRRGFKMVEEVVPAFIKISTSFKAELANIEGNALKVWVFLALSINRNTEEAHPGVRTIAAALKMGENTVIAKIKDLEALGLLLVNREDRKYNIYKIPEYVSANAKMTASKTEAVEETASEKRETASEKTQTASAIRRLNQINQNEPDNNQQLPEFIPLGSPKEKQALRIFVDHFGKLHGDAEATRWLAIVDITGLEQAETIAAWAEKREINLSNRPGLMDSLETATKKWMEPKAQSSGPRYNKPKSAYAQLLEMQKENVNGS
jgi:hypothetical protein